MTSEPASRWIYLMRGIVPLKHPSKQLLCGVGLTLYVLPLGVSVAQLREFKRGFSAVGSDLKDLHPDVQSMNKTLK